MISMGGCSDSRFAGDTQDRTARLMDAYPELRTGRFAVIADFENPAHGELFHLIGVSDNPSWARRERGGRIDTGRACLEFNTGSPYDTLVINNSRADKWFLIRDWRPFDLLLMSVFAPEPDLTLEITIGAGGTELPQGAHSNLTLQQGWNLLRLDLAEVGEHIPLDDVRELRLSVAQATSPMSLKIDDIILTGYRETVMGDPNATDGELFVQRVGRRWKVGAGGRFELTFASGQIVEWYQLAADPNRLHNLVGGTVLGPMLLDTDLTVNTVNNSGFGSVSGIMVRPAILEMNAVRVVISSQWRAADARSAQGAPLAQWTYVIYATGQVYASVEHHANSDTPNSTIPQLAAGWRTSPDQKLHQTTLPFSRDDAKHFAAVGIMQSRSNHAALLFAVVSPQASCEIKNVQDHREKTSSFVVSTVTGAEPMPTTMRWHCHFALLESNENWIEEGLARAKEFITPSPFRFEVGAATQDGHTNLTAAGFDRVDGSFHATPDRGRLRFSIGAQPRSQHSFAPALRVSDPQQRDSWVYVDHLIFDRVARDTHGDLIFQLPQDLKRGTLVEVLFRHPEPLSQP